MVSELPVGSFMIYPTRGRSEASKAAQILVRYMKSREMIREILDLAAVAVRGSPLESYLSHADLLVPVPPHVPTYRDELWVPLHICRHLLRLGIGGHVMPLLRRVTPVPRSTGIRQASERPAPVTHFDSLRVSASNALPTKILLVDDVVTRGSTLVGCASRLHEEYPWAEISALALFRTEGRGQNANLHEFIDMVQPKVQTIRYSHASGELDRF